MKKIFQIVAIAVVSALCFTGCDLNYFPSDELNSDVLLQDPTGAEYIMDGCYALLKDEVEYLGYASGNTYVRHYTQMAEFPADNCCLAGKTTDPLYEALAYMMTDNLKNVGTLWMLAYKVIYMSNTVIHANPEGESKESDQLIGEAYFMRALMHLHMVTLYAKPYAQGRENMGVPLQTEAGSSNITRETVGKVYDQIVKDLQKAAALMGASRGNKGYPSHDAALGLLSRVYLYMGMYNECITTVNEMLGSATPESKLEPDFANYFANAKTSQETLFCIAHETIDDKGQSSAGSMYNGDGGGWGEIYPSDPLLYLYERYPSDVCATPPSSNRSSPTPCPQALMSISLTPRRPTMHPADKISYSKLPHRATTTPSTRAERPTPWRNAPCRESTPSTMSCTKGKTASHASVHPCKTDTTIPSTM